MDFSQEFLENAIFGDYIYDCFRSDDFDQDFIDEILKGIMIENGYQERFIGIIKGIKSYNYLEARRHSGEMSAYASDLERIRRVIRSLLKGIMATSSIVSHAEIKEAKIRWNRYDDQQDYFDPQGHHNLVYGEFKKVESLEELDRFNVYFHNYILDLVFGLSEIYIRRLHYTIEHFKENATMEEACVTGTMNLEKFKSELEKVKTFTPERSE